MKLKPKKNTGLNLIVILIIVTLILCCTGLLIFAAQDGEYISALSFSAFSCIMCVFLTIWLRGMRRWEIMLNENDLVYTPFCGAPKTIPYSSIQKINTGSSIYVLYSMDGKKLLAFDDFHVENASLAVSFLKNKGIKSEL